MIEQSITNSNQTVLLGYCDRLIATAVETPFTPEPTLNLTVPTVCCDCLTVFGGGSKSIQNDKSSFLFTRGVKNGTITFQLLKDGEVVATINDGTYGEYYDFGTWSAYTGQSNYKGYVLYWDTVYSNHGIGSYTFRAEHNILGSVFNID